MPDHTLPGGPLQDPGPLHKAGGPSYPSLQALRTDALVRSIAAGERYLNALRVQEAARRAAHLRYLTREARQDVTRLNHASVEQFEARQRYQAAVAVRPKYFFARALRPRSAFGCTRWRPCPTSLL